jgi:hypothetical protein
MRNSFVFPIALVILLFSCKNKEGNHIGMLDFGTVTPKHSPSKTLVLDFNPEAKKDQSAYVELAFLSGEGDKVPEAYFVVNGKETASNVARIYAKEAPDNELPITLRFKDNAPQKAYKGNLVVVDASDKLKDFITYGKGDDKFSIGDGQVIASWSAKYNRPYPVWEWIIIILAAVLLAAALLWFLLVKEKIYPTFKGGELYIRSDDQKEDMHIRLKGLNGVSLGHPNGNSSPGILAGKHYTALKDADFHIELKPFKKKRNVYLKLVNSSGADVKVSYQNIKNMPIGNEILYNDDEVKINNRLGITYLNTRQIRQDI